MMEGRCGRGEDSPEPTSPQPEQARLGVGPWVGGNAGASSRLQEAWVVTLQAGRWGSEGPSASISVPHFPPHAAGCRWSVRQLARSTADPGLSLPPECSSRHLPACCVPGTLGSASGWAGTSRAPAELWESRQGGPSSRLAFAFSALCLSRGGLEPDPTPAAKRAPAWPPGNLEVPITAPSHFIIIVSVSCGCCNTSSQTW